MRRRYRLLMTPSRDEKVYRWISNLNEHFSLLEMAAIGILYLKDNRNNMYMPFLSKNGKHCRYDGQTGKIMELEA